MNGPGPARYREGHRDGDLATAPKAPLMQNSWRRSRRSTWITIMTSTEPNAKNQHYVWQHYLNGWAAEVSFCCYRHKDKSFSRRSPRSSQAKPISTRRSSSRRRRSFLEDFISKATDERLRELNCDYVKLTQLTFKLRAQLKGANLLPEVGAVLEDNCVGRNGTWANAITPGSKTNPRTFWTRSAAKAMPSTKARCGASISSTSCHSSISGPPRCGKGSANPQLCAGT